MSSYGNCEQCGAHAVYLINRDLPEMIHKRKSGVRVAERDALGRVRCGFCGALLPIVMKGIYGKA